MIEYDSQKINARSLWVEGNNQSSRSLKSFRASLSLNPPFASFLLLKISKRGSLEKAAT